MLKLHPQDIGIIMTYRCPSGCKHCLYNCGPRWEKEAMSPETLGQALEAVAGWPQPPQVHLTGGEPFLYFPLLLEGVQRASQLGLYCYLETSAAWCTKRADISGQFQALHEAGLQAILISCSPFHAERIPPVYTLRAIQAALEIFGPNRVIVYLPNFIEILQHFGLERPTPLSRYEEVLGLKEAGRILWRGYGLISGGRAGYRLGHLVPKQPAAAFEGTNCAPDILYAPHSHLDLYGNYISGFCGGLTVGDWHDLPQLLADFQASRYPLLIDLLIEQGPYGLFELAQAQYGYQPLADGYTGKCHLCVDVRRHLVQTGDFVELRPGGFYENI